MNTLLIIGYVWPEPQSSAAGGRMMEIIHVFLAQHWKIVFASAAQLSPYRADLTSIGVQEKSIVLNDSSFNEFIASINPQAVLFDRFFTEEQFGWRVEQVCPDALRILDTEDLHSLRHLRHKLLKQAQKKLNNETERQGVDPVVAEPDEIFQHMATDDMTVREIAAIFRCDITLIISSFEVELLTDYFSVPRQLLHYLPFIHVPQTAVLPAYDERQHFVCIGNFRHEPNWDAVLYLKHAIWPLIRAHLPETELHIYGAYPPPKATQLHNPKQGFHVKGWADDAQAVMQRARVCLAPLRFGAGLKGKLMDAMRCGTPSVTTSIGAEAMYDGKTWCGLIKNDAQSFADAAIELYSNFSQWQQAQKNCTSIIDNYFCSKNYSQLFTARIDYLKQHLESERRQNFIGTVLRHHTLKSTQYMSQWIEAKNK